MSGLALSMSFLISACTWPDYSHGGMDEAYTYDRQVFIPASLENNERAVDWAERLDDCRVEIDRMYTGAGKIWRPALLQQVDEQWGRTARVFRAGYAPDIETDLAELENMLRQLVAELSDERRILALQDSADVLRPAIGNTEQTSLLALPKVGGQTIIEPVTAEPKIPLTVTVNPGNSLWRLSRRYQGLGKMYPKIVAANSGKINHPDLIYPGQVFVIPELSR